MQRLRLSLNRTVAPRLSLARFLKLAADVGVDAVEIRNDLPGQEFMDGTPAKELAARLRDEGVALASINALQMFNAWSSEREKEAVGLIRYAGACGAPGVVLCPVVSHDDQRSATELARDLRRSLKALAPILSDHGVTAYVEPLGHVESTLRHQRPAVEAIGEVGGAAVLALCHDTFQHYRSSDPEFYPEHTGIVHISGITETALPRDELREPHRGLVDADDVVDNLGQLAILRAGGYDGFVSFEPFSPAVQDLSDPTELLASSVDYVRSELHAATSS